MHPHATPSSFSHRTVKIVALGHIVNHHYIPSSVGNSTLTNGTPRDEEAGRSDSVSALWHALQGGATPLEIAYQTIQDVAGRVTKKYPGHVADLDWGPDAGLELTHEFFTGKDVEDTLAKLLAKAPTEASFRRLLHKALGNFLQQLHRQTPSGRVGRRLTEQISNLGAIPVNPSAWALPAHRGAALCDDEKTLLRVAYMIEFDPVEYDSGSRDSPVISNNDLQKMLSAVLQAAEGPVPFAALVRTISQRTGLGVMPTFVTVDDDAYEIAGDLSSPEDLAAGRPARLRPGGRRRDRPPRGGPPG